MFLNCILILDGWKVRVLLVIVTDGEIYLSTP